MALSMDGCDARLRKLWQALPEWVEWAVISSPDHLAYFCNFFADRFSFTSESFCGVLILERGGNRCLVTDRAAKAAASRAFTDDLRCPVWYDGSRSVIERRAHLVETAIAQLADRHCRHLAIEFSSCPAAIVSYLRTTGDEPNLYNLEPIVRELRRTKMSDEVAVLRQSARAAEAGHQAALREIAPGMTELEAFAVIQQAVVAQAGRLVPLYGDFVAGQRTQSGGGPPTTNQIKLADLFILDFSVVIDEYRCDFANSFTVGARPTPEQLELYEACCEAMAAGERLLRPDTPCAGVDAAVRASFSKRGCEGNFTHHSGHGVGLAHPEPPYIVRHSTDVLREGDVVTLEPGLYVEGLGGVRYERNYLITGSGFEVLSNHALTPFATGYE